MQSRILGKAGHYLQVQPRHWMGIFLKSHFSKRFVEGKFSNCCHAPSSQEVTVASQTCKPHGLRAQSGNYSPLALDTASSLQGHCA